MKLYLIKMRINSLLTICVTLCFITFFSVISLHSIIDRTSSDENTSQRHPPLCLAMPVDSTNKDNKLATLPLQHPISNTESWRLMKCCIQQSLLMYPQKASPGNSNFKSATTCGRYGCCPDSCYDTYLKTNQKFTEAFPSSDYKAFVVETSNRDSLNYRQACAVESLAALNPGLPVYVLMTNESIDGNSPTVSTLKKFYSNVVFRSIYPTGELFMGTPLERWYFCSGWNYGPYAVSHLSEALRVLLLYLFGGYYFDPDIVMMQTIPRYLRNYVSYEDVGFFGSATLHTYRGHPFIKLAVEEFAKTYRIDSWAHNGPLLIMRSMEKWCNVNSTSLMTDERCKGINILPYHQFFPVAWQDHEDYFLEMPHKIPELNKVFNKTVIGVHVWNKLSEKIYIRKHSQHQLVAKIAFSKCPRIVEIAPDLF